MFFNADRGFRILCEVKKLQLTLYILLYSPPFDID
jgi:hypothetical protein